ncbi:3-deoxy-D-manno-octulosonic acid transferase [Flavobacteriaceae bacterium]|jgi:3-deoxy-D-manno-octulosonic-acid transferase|nr:3-deoxy-D-manno-octulosonic acid transferase [Flavobacteriaceae bacterium]MDB2647951.1 3-deoxy-D-manno-octulosonic acid transferase [Flavobacteriaceae bacterium]MDB9846605.1 3-deoxy-D-manno-octulosonic acid transferase [Flavobacteriaceae bacterium]MDC0553855.1 3-deoxy-D-manno-octulosonic acid transferase [Flavobacteriaceae bacterium]MDC0631289.1 3-deoxy-D-manno-octulosonic acid transferase [Flavobacteriaceae bacterium]
MFILKYFNSKIRSFNNERKNVLKNLENSVSKNDNHIWIHVASLGEYEQGLPIFKEIKSLYKNHKIILSFFSSSGYEVRKNNSIGDLTIYLPLDSPYNAKKFISLLNLKMAFFVKYDFWPNYLQNLKNNNVPTYLLAGLFRENHWFFKWYGSGFLNLLKSSITHFFVQNKESKSLLASYNITNCTLMGDSRFDRVNSLLNQNNEIKNIKEFIGDKICLVAGSTWKEDESIMINSINDNNDLAWIIAPHQINKKQIKKFQDKLKCESIIHSNLNQNNITTAKVLIIDSIGLLTRLYSYSDISYVGGGMGNSGLHNILEPAIFKNPILIGKNYLNFPEAKNLIAENGAISVKDAKEFKRILNELIENKRERIKMGEINFNYIKSNLGTTKNVISYLKERK